MRNRLTGILIFRYIIHSLSTPVLSLLAETNVTISWRDQRRNNHTAYLQFKGPVQSDGSVIQSDREFHPLNSRKKSREKKRKRKIPAIYMFQKKNRSKIN